QMTPQGFDIGDALSTFAKLAPILLSASPTGQPAQSQTSQPAQGQMTPQGFDIGDALSTFAPLLPLLLLSASPAGQQASGQTVGR
ncbi:hypothetical protein ABZT04_32405, partial [Streptomyces sp. NPDC005492]|uniref:hypothetical protein n=1 Tax=Streptomyces sp. NPDC005492 TaxID=3156883 RepID=UPI0033B01F07